MLSQDHTAVSKAQHTTAQCACQTYQGLQVAHVSCAQLLPGVQRRGVL